jgi:hypothetical protein
MARPVSPGGRSFGSATWIAVVVLAVVVASMGAFLVTTSDDGAATPQDAVHTLVEAVIAGDLVGVVEALPPGERRVLRQPLTDLANELARLGLTDGLDPARVRGAGLSVTDRELQVTELAPTVAAVDVVGGSVRIDGDPDELPLTGRLRDLLAEDFGVDLDGVRGGARDLAADPLRLMVVHEGGGWHVSLAYSLAEWARASAGAPLPAFGEGPDAIGGNTPDDTVRDLVKAYADSDPERAVTLLSPVEARALYDYAPLFLDPVKRAGRRGDDEGAYDAQVNRLDLRTEGTGGTRTVHITALDLDLRDEVKKTHVAYDGSCLVQDYRFADTDPPFARWSSCDDDAVAGDAASRPRDNPLSYVAVFGGGVDPPVLTVVERNGRWFVSPVGSLLASSVDALRRLSTSGVEAAAERIGPSVRSLTDDRDGPGPVADDRPTNDPDRLLAECARLGALAAEQPGAAPARADAVAADCAAHLVEQGRLPPP